MSVLRDADGTERRCPTWTPARLNGRVDALDGNRLHGWIWDEMRPDQAMSAQALSLMPTRIVGETVADQSRIDLRRNGIGDGAPRLLDGARRRDRSRHATG